MTSTPIALKTITEMAYSFHSCSRSGIHAGEAEEETLDRAEEARERPRPALEHAIEPEPDRLREKEDEEGEEPDLKPAGEGHGLS